MGKYYSYVVTIGPSLKQDKQIYNNDIKLLATTEGSMYIVHCFRLYVAYLEGCVQILHTFYILQTYYLFSTYVHAFH
jgi:hypothetical protein